MFDWLFATFHLLALGIGFGAIVTRALALRPPLDPTSLRQALTADAWWGIAALLWIGTGLTRLIVGWEKPTAYYLSNPVFWAKMGVLGLVLVLEIGPMLALIRWRIALAKGRSPDLDGAARFAAISWFEAGLVVLMVFLATALARGHGAA